MTNLPAAGHLISLIKVDLASGSKTGARNSRNPVSAALTKHYLYMSWLP